MSKVLVCYLIPLSRRSYSVAAESAGAAQVVARRAAAAAETTTMESVGSAKEEDISWMRDPKTGCWIPENRFNEVDAVDLRALLLPKKY